MATSLLPSISSTRHCFTPPPSPSPSPSPSFLPAHSFFISRKTLCSFHLKPDRAVETNGIISSSSRKAQQRQRQLCKAAGEYVFPDTIPEFADAETEKFRTYMLERLAKKDIFGDSIEEIVGVCTEIMSNFLHTEYGGPGTLLVIPFIDMADTLNERELPGGPQAARAAVVWAQKHIDNDWKEWTGAGSIA